MKHIKHLIILLAFLPRLLLAQNGQAPNGVYPVKLPPTTITSLTASNALLGSTIVTNGLTVTNALLLASGDLTVSTGVTRVGQLVATSPGSGLIPISAYPFGPAPPGPNSSGLIWQLFSGNQNHGIGLEAGGPWISCDGQVNFWYMSGATTSKKFSFGVSSGVFQVNGASGLVTVLDTNAVFYGSFNGSGGNLTNFVNAVFAKTGNYTVTTAESGAVYDNNGAGGAVTNTLPAATVGLNYSLDVVAAQNFAFKANGTDTIRNAASVSAAGGLAFSSTIGTQIGIRCDVAGKWVLYMAIGTITIQ